MDQISLPPSVMTVMIIDAIVKHCEERKEVKL